MSAKWTKPTSRIAVCHRAPVAAHSVCVSESGTIEWTYDRRSWAVLEGWRGSGRRMRSTPRAEPTLISFHVPLISERSPSGFIFIIIFKRALSLL